MLKRAGNLYREYPQQFWLVMGATFIDRLGGALLFPFFALFLTDAFDVGLTDVGVLFMIVTVFGIVGSGIGGALSDRYGRKKMILFGLVVSATTSLSLLFATNFNQVYFVGVFVGFFSSIAGPSQQAIIADILPEEQHNEGYAMWRVVANVAITFGPLIGGILAGYSYAYLFIIDASTSIITAIILAFLLEESAPVAKVVEADVTATGEDVPKPTYGYMPILRDTAFLIFVFLTLLMVLAYTQMYQTLPVYLRDQHGIPPRGYGYILSINAAMVVLLQFWTTRRIKHWSPFLIMAAGSILYAIGFAMYGFVSGMALFILAMVIITVGEMFTAPTGQTLVAKFAPADMRGRYMAIYGFSWAIPSAMGLLVAGLLTDNVHPNAIWYLSGVLAFIVTLGFLAMHQPERVPLIGRYFRPSNVPDEDVAPAMAEPASA
ncbi:MAG: MFS transporter [Chloroflexi bacterium]|nr:MFS transporter [Chloroflexota bacterium]